MQISIPLALLREQIQSDRDRIWVIGQLLRPGVLLASTAIEYCIYPPGTEANDQLPVNIVTWEAIDFIILGCPRKDRNRWQQLIDACGLRPANGVPAIFDHGHIKHFPINTMLCRTLEFRKGHRLYSQNPVLVQEAIQTEVELAQKIHDGWRPSASEIKEKLGWSIPNENP